MKTRAFTSRAAWLAILAVIWHALLPLAHAASATRTQAGAQGLFASICTTGPARDELIRLPSGKQDAPAVDLLKQCPLCATGSHVALSDNPTPVFKPDATLAHVQSTASRRSATPARVWLHFSPRGPPGAA